MIWQFNQSVLLPVISVGVLLASAASAASPEAVAVLERMEARHIKSLEADLRWEHWYTVDLPDEREIKEGEIWYGSAPGDELPKFKVSLKKRIIAGRASKLDEEHLFDGYWYVEKTPVSKMVTRREVRRKGDPGNPFRLGEGPFPVPFGQKKADVLRQFEVTLAEPTKDDPTNTDHLVCKPRQTSNLADLYAQVDFWIVKSGELSGLPIKLKAEKLDKTGRVDSHIVVSFKNAKLDTKLDPDTFEIRTPFGYQEQVEKLPPPETLPPRQDPPRNLPPEKKP